MSVVSVKFAPQYLRSLFFGGKDSSLLVKTYMQEYTTSEKFVIVESGEEAAEEVFDLTNNPSREDERFSTVFAEHRQVSVGDVVQVIEATGDVTEYVCEPIGWSVLI